jgi:hypothetical protein
MVVFFEYDCSPGALTGKSEKIKASADCRRLKLWEPTCVVGSRGKGKVWRRMTVGMPECWGFDKPIVTNLMSHVRELKILKWYQILKLLETQFQTIFTTSHPRNKRVYQILRLDKVRISSCSAHDKGTTRPLYLLLCVLNNNATLCHNVHLSQSCTSKTLYPPSPFSVYPHIYSFVGFNTLSNGSPFTMPPPILCLTFLLNPSRFCRRSSAASLFRGSEALGSRKRNYIYH